LVIFIYSCILLGWFVILNEDINNITKNTEILTTLLKINLINLILLNILLLRKKIINYITNYKNRKIKRIKKAFLLNLKKKRSIINTIKFKILLFIKITIEGIKTINSLPLMFRISIYLTLIKLIHVLIYFYLPYILYIIYNYLILSIYKYLIPSIILLIVNTIEINLNYIIINNEEILELINISNNELKILQLKITQIIESINNQNIFKDLVFLNYLNNNFIFLLNYFIDFKLFIIKYLDFSTEIIKIEKFIKNINLIENLNYIIKLLKFLEDNSPYYNCNVYLYSVNSSEFDIKDIDPINFNNNFNDTETSLNI
jgi:hypothetical protein